MDFQGLFGAGAGAFGAPRVHRHHDCVVVVDTFTVPVRHRGFGVDGESEGIVSGDDDAGRGRLARGRHSYRVSVRVGEAQRPVVEAPYIEAALVYQAVVHRAQQQEVVERGLSALGPVVHVVPVQAMGGRAAGESAASIAAQECAANRRGNATGAPADAQRLSPRSVHSGDDS